MAGGIPFVAQLAVVVPTPKGPRMRETWQSAVRLIRNYPRVLKLVWDTHPGHSVLAVLLTTGSALALPAQIWVTKLIIDRLAGYPLGPAPRSYVDWYSVLAPVGILALVWAWGSVCQTLAGRTKELLSIQVRHHTEYLILHKATQLDIAFFEHPSFYDQMDMVRKEAYRTNNLAYRSLDFLGSLISLGAMLGLLFQLHPLAVGVLLLTSAPRAFLGGYFANRFYGLFVDRAAARRTAQYFAELISSRDTAKEARLFGLDQPFLERFRGFLRAYFAEERKVRVSQERANIVLSLFSLVGAAGIWGYAIVQAVRSHITLGTVSLVLQTVEQARSRMGALFSEAGELYENSLYTANLFSFLDLVPGSVEGALSRPPGASGLQLPVPKPIQQGIEFCNVSFRYPHTDQYVLRNLSCTLRPGVTTALVGENGAGKTTLVKLMVRFYDPTEGFILLDGKDLRDYDLESLRRQFGVIFQDFVRFDLTARENIGMGQIERVDDLARVKAAAKTGGAQPIIDRLPGKFEQVLGRRFEGGMDLSGGEWQKIALSRAFMREAQILVLDEPTAALDALAENEVYQRLAQLSVGKTTIFISHRFSTVRMADHILVLENGALREEGTHESLMAANGQYARMFNLQAAKYR